MEHTRSADGTCIAYERTGSGRPVVLVAGALSDAGSMRPLAAAFGAAGLTGVCWDRRGRGDSGDAPVYSPRREVEDLAAVVRAVGGSAVVLGHSAGAVLALLAAAAGVPMDHLVVSEPVLRFGVDEPPADLADRLQALVDDGRGVDAVLMFQRENVRLAEAQVDSLRRSPDLAGMVALARTTVYDTQLLASASTPTANMLGADVAMTIIRGEPAAPVLVAACERLAALVPRAELVVVPESRDHVLNPTGTVSAVLSRLT